MYMYKKSAIVIGFLTRQRRHIQFTLVADDFGIKYTGKYYSKCLMIVLKEYCEILTNWEVRNLLEWPWIEINKKVRYICKCRGMWKNHYHSINMNFPNDSKIHLILGITPSMGRRLNMLGMKMIPPC